MEKNCLISVVLMVACGSALAYAPEGASREERFANPPASARLLPIYHSWSHDGQARTRGLDALERRGFGGFVGNANFDAGYLASPDNRREFKSLVEAAKHRGLRVWLYDEPGYPSGTAGGAVTTNHPERAAQGYLLSSGEVDAGATVTLAVPPGRFVGAAAWALTQGRLSGKRILISRQAGSTNVVWTAPTGAARRWRAVAWSIGELYEGTHAAVNLSRRIPYINLLSPEPTDAFIACTHEVYADLFGGDLSAFDSLFTDEPSLMSLWMRPRPWSVLPHSGELAEEWRRRTGRTLDDDAPTLAFGAAEENMRALRHAFWNAVGNLVSANYMRRIDEWARAHGTRGGGHLLLEEWTGVQLPLYGDFFRCLRALGNPGIDMLTSLPPDVSPQSSRFAGSAGALNGAARVMCEVSDHVQRRETSPVRQVTADEISGTLNRLLWGGVNTFTSYYVWEPFSDEQIAGINLRLGRVNTILTEGRDASDVALLYPADTMKTDYDAKPQAWCEVSGQAFHAIATMQTAARGLFFGNRAWAFVDAPSLAEAEVGSVAVTQTNGLGGVVCTFGGEAAWGHEAALVREGLVWRAVVLPGVDTLPTAAMRKLRDFWKAGGLVIAFGAVPVNSESEFPSAEVTALSREVFGTAAAAGRSAENRNGAGGLGMVFPGEATERVAAIVSGQLEPPIAVEGDVSRLRTAHRRGDAGDVFFVINDSASEWRGKLRICGGGRAERWDPQNGEHGAFAVDGKGWGELVLPAYGSVLLTTRSPANPRRLFPTKQER